MTRRVTKRTRKRHLKTRRGAKHNMNIVEAKEILDTVCAVCGGAGSVSSPLTGKTTCADCKGKGVKP